jgi:hypothetical protein
MVGLPAAVEAAERPSSSLPSSAVRVHRMLSQALHASAAVVAMFLMTLNRQPMSAIFPFMRHCRPIVFTPAMNFSQSIQTWEKTFFSYINQLKRKK